MFNLKYENMYDIDEIYDLIDEFKDEQESQELDFLNETIDKVNSVIYSLEGRIIEEDGYLLKVNDVETFNRRGVNSLDKLERVLDDVTVTGTALNISTKEVTEDWSTEVSLSAIKFADETQWNEIIDDSVSELLQHKL